jgi:hypothetical protein
MKIPLPFQDGTMRSLVITLGIVIGSTLLLAMGYFYVYLPAVTNHGETITVPDVHGMKFEDARKFLTSHDLRVTIGDSIYSEDSPPLSVLRQFPKQGTTVKEGRIIYLSINRVTPPTLPLLDLTERSLTWADLIIKSNELRRGKVFYKSSPYLNYVLEMHYQGKIVTPGTRVPKGAVIDLVVGDGNGPSDFKVGSLIGDSYKRALFKLEGWNLNLGRVEIPADTDTTGVELFVYKQSPAVDDSVKVGDPVDLWIAPKGYQVP